MSQSLRNTAESKENGLEKLSELVKADKLDEIKDIVKKAKVARGYQWYWSNKYYVERAARDAILLDQIETIRYFLDEELSPSARVAAYVNEDSGVLISFAAKSHNLPIVKLLVERGADIKPRDDFYDKGDNSGIRAAVIANATEIVSYLLEKGADTNGFVPHYYGGMTFLATAAEYNNIQMVESLLNYGASIRLALVWAREKLNIFRGNETESNYLKGQFIRICRLLLDYAAGIDFKKDDIRRILEGISISGFNFLGVSIDGEPITHEIIKEYLGADKTIVSRTDLANMQDISRQQFLTDRLEQCIQKRGSLVSNEGIVNLVPLLSAAKIGDLKAVETRLKAGADYNDGTDKDDNPIIQAAKNGHLNVVKLLVEYPNTAKQQIAAALNNKLNEELPNSNPFPNVLTNIIADYFCLDLKSMMHAIEAAKSNKHIDVVNYLSNLLDVNTQDEQGNTLLHIAISKYDTEQVKSLINKGANVNLTNKAGKTPLILAADCYDEERYEKATNIVSQLLEAEADANQYIREYSPLSYAVRRGNLETIKLLLPRTEKKEIIRRDYKNNETSRAPWYVDLMFEAEYRQKAANEILSLLKDYGADFNQKNENGLTLLNQAVKKLPFLSDLDIERYKMNMVRMGLDRFPEEISRGIEQLINEKKENFLKILNVIHFLLKNNADINLAAEDGLTPLDHLINVCDISYNEEEYKQTLELFLKFGINVNAKTENGITYLHKAADHGDRIAIDFLVKNGADINAKTTDKQQTPLHHAVLKGFVKTTELLLKLGSDTNAFDSDGLTPLELCGKDKCCYLTSLGIKNVFANASLDEKSANTDAAIPSKQTIRKPADFKEETHQTEETQVSQAISVKHKVTNATTTEQVSKPGFFIRHKKTLIVLASILTCGLFLIGYGIYLGSKLSCNKSDTTKASAPPASNSQSSMTKVGIALSKEQVSEQLQDKVEENNSEELAEEKSNHLVNITEKPHTDTIEKSSENTITTPRIS